ncbi:hypothetical protein OHS33_35520 [Streptomyces sp. NBC_00536]|uniref:hypothetical protein n=1 Tax=Streptomyces sp. NBC_00536 TaxID=2975769 RepID=UPI002E7FF81D|nr:hypothetical protein [Streptomyces sp. NBC_00536]WUC83216.1 hypothetical protein OHS33_35520 [Streptomyces sp. NBC_00536]
MTLAGLPDEFKVGSDWQGFSLHVDNSGRPAADDYSLELVLWAQDTLSWKSSDIQAEVYAPDTSGTWGWHKIEPDGSEEVYSLSIADVDIKQNEIFDLKLRMKFAKGAAPSRFTLSTTAEGGTADRVRYLSQVTNLPAANTGPKVKLKGLPENGFTAGGDWQPLSLSIDNSGREALERYGFAFSIQNNERTLKAGHLDLEVWDGNRWTAAEKGRDLAAVIFDHAVGKNAKFDIQLRAKIAPSAPIGKAFIIVDADDYAQTKSDKAFAYTSITTRATPGDGGHNGTGTPGNQPKPDDALTPVISEGGISGGQLAVTGSDPATGWALGGAGVTLAMGAALVAGTGKRRRTT